MRTVFIALNGKPRSGKDEFAKFAVKYLNGLGQDGIVYSTITTCVKMAEIAGYTTYYDESVPKTPRQREMLSELKDWYTAWFDGTFHEMVELITESMTKYEGEPDSEKFNFIFAMIREPSEIQKIKEYCIDNNVFFRSIIGSGPRSELGDSCHSDRNVNQYDYDEDFMNDGSLDDLERKAIQFVKWMVEQFMNFEEDNLIESGVLEPK